MSGCTWVCEKERERERERERVKKVRMDVSCLLLHMKLLKLSKCVISGKWVKCLEYNTIAIGYIEEGVINPISQVTQLQL